MTQVTGSLKTAAALSDHILWHTHQNTETFSPSQEASWNCSSGRQRQGSEKSHTTIPFRWVKSTIFFREHVNEDMPLHLQIKTKSGSCSAFVQKWKADLELKEPGMPLWPDIRSGLFGFFFFLTRQRPEKNVSSLGF